jgi:hypothetical protein
MGEEAYGYVFAGIDTTSGANVASFSRHPTGSYPNECKLLPATEAGPSGFDKEWKNGLVIVEGRPRRTTLWRKT